MADQSEPREPRRAAGPEWRRLRGGTVLPILFLLALLLLLGHLHVDLASGYTSPRWAGDEQGGFVFYDEGTRDSAFYVRRTLDGRSFTKRRRVRGILCDAALEGPRLVALYGEPRARRDDEDWFYTLYERDGAELRRTWSGTFSEPDLGLERPCGVARLGSHVLVFGSDGAGALRVARLTEAGNLLPLEARLPGAAALPPRPDDEPEQAAPTWIKPFSAVEQEGRLTLAWRAVRPGDELDAAGIVRFVEFDGERFGEPGQLGEDLAALDLVAAPEPDGPLLLFGVPRQGDAQEIAVYARRGAGFEQQARLPCRREGFAAGGGVIALAAGRVGQRLVLFAQAGGTIRVNARDAGKDWEGWQDFARLPVEQRAVIYGWFFSVLTLCGALILNGLSRLGRPRRAPDAPPRAAVRSLDEAASVPERTLAFMIDATAVMLLCGFLAPAALVERAAEDPQGRLVLAACYLACLLAYCIAFEALFGRTPGKRLLRLEVQDLGGGRPRFAALLYRNLFRIELLLPPAWVVAPLSLLMMLVSQHHQRPGDLLARTTVRRTGTARLSEAA